MNNIYERYFRVLVLITVRDLLLQCTSLSDSDAFIRLDRHSEKSQMVTQLQYRCDIATWVPWWSTNVTQRTVQLHFLMQQQLNSTHTVWKLTEMFNSALIFYILSTGIRSLILTLLHIEGDILQDT